MDAADTGGGIARRIQGARRAAGLSQSEVAQELAIPRSAISLMESGQRAISSSELAKLSRLFSVAPSLLLFEPEADRLRRFFRADAAVDEQDQQVIEQALQQLQEYAQIEQRTYGVQRYSLPSYPLPPGRVVAQGEYLARQERRRLGLDLAPVPSVIELLEREGVKVLLCTFPRQSSVSGCYLFSSELGPCVVIKEGEQATRQRFTAAHEYGHFLMDREEVRAEVCDIKRRQEHSEMRSNAFAAAFLLPVEGVEAVLREHGAGRGQVHAEHVLHVMHHFGVSYDAALWRLLNLRWITPEERSRLAAISPAMLAEVLGFPKEPALAEPPPNRLYSVSLDAWRQGVLSLEGLARILTVRPEELERILGQQEPRVAIPDFDEVDPDWF